MSESISAGLEIAIVGMAGRFPGASDVDAFWANIRDGVESIARFDREALVAAGAPAELLDAEDFVAAGAPIEGADRFDAAFFGYAPGEAELLDPQQRIFLECAWHALEDAGCAPGAFPGAIGVFASAGMNGYLLNLYGNARLRRAVTPYELFTSNDKDFLATRAAYKLNLRGPAVTVQTACSSSLVAVHMAAQSLIAGECDMALAGGVALSRQAGYRAMKGGILSPTGRCRAFDAAADGTVAGNGVGIVVLKRLEDALSEGDRIDAVIRGSAINNDGGGKAGFTAPDAGAQAEAIAAALAAAGISPDEISYVEAHGTGTSLGDPVEIAALTRAFRRGTDRRGFCAIGSVKTNIGHLDTAAGVAGLIKTALMLRWRTLAPSLHFEAANPRIDFASSPFAVNAARREWASEGLRRAGVSSFGIGGTNAHVVLEEAPPAPPRETPEGPELLVLSAKTAGALEGGARALADHLERGAAPLCDVARTLAEGREPLRWRRAIVARSGREAAARLRGAAGGDAAPGSPSEAVFLFPGQGAQRPGMARRLYEAAPAFAATLDEAALHMGAGFLPMIFGDGEAIHRTENAQPALFAVEIALARLWGEMGVRPRALLGHSLGELTAACVAGVFGFEEGLDLVAARGRLMQAAAPGAMLAVIHPDRPLDDLLVPGVEIAAENGPGLSAISGEPGAIEAVARRFDEAGIGWRRLRTSHGFHSAAMEGAAVEFARAVSKVRLSAPTIPVVSNLTGTWLTDREATDPEYWGRQLRDRVRFGAGAATLLGLDAPVFLELGPGSTLTGLLRHQVALRASPCLETGMDEVESLLAAIGEAWRAGVAVDWRPLAPGRRRKVALPLYPFERERFWVEPDAAPAAAASPSEAKVYAPAWRRSPLPAPAGRTRRSWLVLDDGELGRALAEALERGGDDAWRAEPGERFAETGYRAFSLPGEGGGAAELLDALASRAAPPTEVVFLWPLGAAEAGALHRALGDLVAALAARPREVRLTIATRGAADVTGAETLAADRAALHGLAEVAGQEYPWIGCRILDLDPEERGETAELAAWLRSELIAEAAPLAARRGGRRWTLEHEALSLPPAPDALRRDGVFAVIGHVAEGVGRVWAAEIAALEGARLALVETPGARAFDLPESERLLRLRADCGDAGALGRALDEVSARWGRIDGVFLSTPFSDAGTTAPLALLSGEQEERARAGCVAPAEALAAAAAGRRIGFCCVQSSLSLAIGGVGLAAHSAAHHRAALVVAAEDREARADWFALAFDALAGEGAGPRPERGPAEDFSLSRAEVWEATRRVLGARLTGLSVVSRGDVDARRARWLNPAPRREEEAEARSGRRRPEIGTPFVAPRTPLETSVAAILQELLGLDRIGVDDGFFELGGHSLLAIRAIARLREAFPVRIEMRELLVDNPSVAGIARLIEAKLAADDELAALVAEVSALSEAELEAALEAEEVGR